MTNLGLQLKRHGIHQLIDVGLIAHTCVEAKFVTVLSLAIRSQWQETLPPMTRRSTCTLRSDVNIPYYASVVVSTSDIVDAIASMQPARAGESVYPGVERAVERNPR